MLNNNHPSHCLKERLKVLRIEFREFCVVLPLKQIESIFSSSGFTLVGEFSGDGTRRGLVDAFYKSTDWTKEESAKLLFKAIEYTMQLYYLENDAKEYIRNLCEENGFFFKENRILTKFEDSPENTFVYQFPVGLPFGIPKPSFSISAREGGQTLRYDLQNGLGLIEGKIYPNFSFKDLENLYGLDSSTNSVLKQALVEMNQASYERDFFLKYVKKFQLLDKPVLIPQAWIQWHSQSKRNLRAITSGHTDELYRVDFVAFWNNQRYVILVDDISHYAVKSDSQWRADEESYAKRLKEDRKLRKENWHVFRVSNWELRDDNKTQAILDDLREFIGF